MNSIYTDNKEICLFVNRAQNKIADIGTIVVDRGGDLPDSIGLALELASFLESLDSVYTTWTVDQVLSWIHEYNYRANLNEVAYLNLYGFTTTILCDCGGSGGGISLPITTADISDYVIATNNLIRKFPHNQLSGLQGGTIDERYHVSKAMYDFLVAATSPPSTTSTVNLDLAITNKLWPSGYYELGSSIGVVTLTGSINYGTDKKALYFEYTKGTSSLSRNSNPTPSLQPNAITDTSFISGDTTYAFTAAFSDGIKTSIKYVKFRQPMYYGVVKRSDLADSSKLLTGKDVRDRGEMSLTFNIPIGNTELAYSQSSTPFLFIPKSWGKFTSAITLGFDFSSDFTAIDRLMTLADGTTADGLLITYNPQIEDINTFKFNW